jgi:glycosyltransferase involved in cell wall biosynthesis
VKILQAFDLFTPHGGGTVDLVYKLSQALAQRGHEVTVYTSDYKLDKAYIESVPEVKVYPFHLVSSLGGFYLMPGQSQAAREHLREFDIIHLHCFRSYQNVVLRNYALKYGVPYVLDTHGSLPRMGGGFKRLLKFGFDIAFGGRILRDASRVIAETEVGVREYEEFGAANEKIALIPPPFAVEEFAHLPQPGRFRNRYNIKEKHIVTFLGRIHKIKGIDFLVESFHELVKSRQDTRLVIIGNDDGYKSELDGQIDKLNLKDKILFTGFLGGDEKLAALVDADIVIQTSRYEQGAWAPFEAVLCGTPIIVTGHTGAGEDVKRLDAGALVEFGNTSQLAQMISKILDNPSEGRARAAKAAQHIRENLSMKKKVQDYEELYTTCLKERQIA